MLIVFEGIDGCGKSTQARMLSKCIMPHQEVVFIKEPSEFVDIKSGTPKHFLEDRLKYSVPKIKAGLSRDMVVIMDRYYYSTMAYQSAKGYDLETIREENEEFCPAPDLLFIFDIDPQIAVRRITAKRKLDEWEMDISYLYQVSKIYQDMDFTNYQVNIDAHASPFDVFEGIIETYGLYKRCI